MNNLHKIVAFIVCFLFSSILYSLDFTVTSNSKLIPYDNHYKSLKDTYEKPSHLTTITQNTNNNCDLEIGNFTNGTSFDDDGGYTDLPVSINDGCFFIILTSEDWVTITQTATGYHFAVASNPETTSRSANITLISDAFEEPYHYATITQNAYDGCDLEIGTFTNGTSFDDDGGYTDLPVSINAGCFLAIIASEDWVTITQTATGYHFAATSNPETSYRSANIIVISDALEEPYPLTTITQNGYDGCDLEVGDFTNGTSFGDDGGYTDLPISVNAGCFLAIIASDDWVTITQTATGYRFTVPSINELSYRTSNITIISDALEEPYVFTRITQGAVLDVSSNKNHILTRTYQDEYSVAPDYNTLDSDLIQEITYYDGLGRPKQNINIGYSVYNGSVRDLVTHIEYDEYGRMEKEWLPYLSSNAKLGIFRNNVNVAVNNFYNTEKYEYTQNPYSEKLLEPSPLGRVMEQAAPGTEWAVGNGHTIMFDYRTNNATEVRLYKVALNASYTPTLTGGTSYYGGGQLYKTITKDENHDGSFSKLHTTQEFKNNQGQVILKRTYALIDGEETKHDTYYVYDDYGNLTYVIPPKVDTSDGVSSTELNELCYQYKYDERNRLIEKKVPGKGDSGNWEEIVYNKSDQPILTRDPLLKSQNKWFFTKYDAFGRVAYTGILNSGSNRTTLQTAANGITTLWVTRGGAMSLGGTTVYYNNEGYPNTGTIEILTVNYYDNYEIGNQIEYNPASGSITWNGMRATNQVKGLATVTRTKVLGITEDKWITAATYYDEKGRPWETYLRNEYLDVTEWAINQLDFTGKVLKTASSHQKGSDTPIVTIENFEYDHMGRLVSQYHCIGANLLTDDCSGRAVAANLVLDSTITSNDELNPVASNSITMESGFSVVATSSLSFTASITDAGTQTGGELIVANHYDELGQLDSKKVGGATDGGGLQTVDYTYNIRGWLKEINEGATNNDDLFGFKINYNTPDYSPNTRGLFNGNISETHWITANDNKNRNYRYEYDALNRITDAINIGDNEGHRYRIIDITYDKNGNIEGFSRNGWQNNGTYGNMDVLEYTYDSGNKLTKVLDNGNDDYGFIDGANTSIEYTYDANGNMTRDFNKEIGNATTDGITYNHLNLPTEVKFNNLNTRKINYIYSADGSKLQKLVNDNGNETITDYAGNYIYENDVLRQFSHSEGYVEVDGSGEYDYVYSYLDHLGSVRLTYSDFNGNGTIEPNTEILQERNTYPFGLEHKGYNNVQNGVESNYKTYLGQEMNKELGLNWLTFRHRNYDPSIGRFFGIDPITEEYHYITPYQFASNNPVWKIELEGLEGKETSGLDLIRQGFENMWNAAFGGIKVGQNGMAKRSNKERATQFSRGGNMVAKGAATKEVAHLALDAAGTVDPTPIIDTGHAIWYGAEGEYGNALFTIAGVIPYFGDTFKAGKYLKYGDDVADLVKATGKIDGAPKEIVSVLKEGTLGNGIKVANDVIGGLGDDAVDYISRAGKDVNPNYGKVVGRQSANGKKGWRVDYDTKKGGHLNWWNGKEKGAIILNAGQEQIDQVIKNVTF